MFEAKQRLAVTPKAQFLPDDSAATLTMETPRAHLGARDPSIDHRVGPTAVWKPASSARIDVVETTVILGTMTYFAYGVGAAFGLF